MRLVLVLPLLLMFGCQSSQVRQERTAIIQNADDVVLCYSLIDNRFQLEQSAVLKELKSREVVSCLTVIAEYECPETMESRQSCIDETRVRVTGELKAIQSAAGTELLIKGIQVGIGVLPF